MYRLKTKATFLAAILFVVTELVSCSGGSGSSSSSLTPQAPTGTLTFGSTALNLALGSTVTDTVSIDTNDNGHTVKLSFAIQGASSNDIPPTITTDASNCSFTTGQPDKSSCTIIIDATNSMTTLDNYTITTTAILPNGTNKQSKQLINLQVTPAAHLSYLLSKQSTNTNYSYAVNTNDGSLTFEAQSSQESSSFLPTGEVISHNYAYIVSNKAKINQYAISATGTWKYLASFTPPENSGINSASDIGANGEYIYIPTNKGIETYKISANDGSLTFMNTTDSNSWYTSMSIEGNWLYAVNNTGKSLSYSINTAGQLTQTANVVISEYCNKLVTTDNYAYCLDYTQVFATLYTINPTDHSLTYQKPIDLRIGGQTLEILNLGINNNIMYVSYYGFDSIYEFKINPDGSTTYLSSTPTAPNTTSKAINAIFTFY